MDCWPNKSLNPTAEEVVYNCKLTLDGGLALVLSRPAAYLPSGGRLQSHHGLQQEWAANNLPGYDPKLAPTVTIETGKGFPHTTLSNLQNARRDARVAAGLGKWSSTIDDELGFIVSDFRQEGKHGHGLYHVGYGNLDLDDAIWIAPDLHSFLVNAEGIDTF
ncbi:MAG: hypothetical protein R3B84_20555 [Zavarzinella sp.]